MGYFRKAEHPLLSHALRILRDRNTPMHEFRTWMKIASQITILEATRDLPLFHAEATSPVAPFTGEEIKTMPHFVVILRAGLGMLEGALSLFPHSKVSFLGLARDEKTLQASSYMERLPENFQGEPVIILEPMIATGNSLNLALKKISSRKAQTIKVVSIIAFRGGITKVAAQNDVEIITAAIDENLNERGFIVPGLGDAGDRLWDG